MKDVAILIPALGRHETVPKVIRSIRRSDCNAKIVFICSRDDGAVIEQVNHDPEAECLVVPRWEHGDYAKKINYGYRETKEPLLFLGATDLQFHNDWFTLAKSKLTDGIGVVGTNDLGNPEVRKGRHSTHSLVTRDYVDEFGVIDNPGQVLHEGYWHEFVDNEFVETAMYRDAWAMAMDSVVEHMHPWFGKAEWDANYRAYRRRYHSGKDLYESRKHLWT